MPKRMVIDASHPEETRVVVLDGQKVEEFDFEAATKRPLKGNIYLAKVTRVEPSLQAAFVEYGGNRQGFLAFSEIHPDYYQIPVADRMALLAEQQEEARRHAEEEFESVETMSVPAQENAMSEEGSESEHDSEHDDRDEDEDESGEHEHHDGGHEHRDEHRHDSFETQAGESSENENSQPEHYASSTDEQPHFEDASAAGNETPGADSELPSENGGLENPHSEFAEMPGDGLQESGGETSQDMQPAQPLQSSRPQQRWTRKRHYKIQEVIKRRQIILVQVVKEERGNKGAALTTYLSLAGRYCVLMPNTPRGGGISRKITNANDRKRLKSAAQALELPEGMGLIIRTAGENRTKVEIKRDYEYLLRMWDTIRELTLKSNAPACVYEEGDLIKRAIRDLYNKDVAEIIVEGDDGYRNAKDFMRMLMPSHAKNVKPYKEPVPLFQRHHIEAQLDAMFSPTVTLKSGGYIVINQTEALVSIDVNSGRATREHSIEETAHKTNLEAADEIGRQLRLRDLAGLIVIDFIDMEDGRNDRNVEKRIRDAVKNDRARIQIGKISQFGLLEMSRQRLRAGVIAGSTVPCPHCGGQGIVRSVESTALRVLRSLDEEGQRQRANTLIVRVSVDVAVYTLNQKRRELARIESDNGIMIQFEPKDGVVAGNFEIERIGQRAPDERPKLAPPPEPVFEPESLEDAEEAEIEEVEEDEAQEERPQEVHADMPPRGDVRGDMRSDGQPRADGQPQGEGGKRRRRRRRRGRDRDRPAIAPENGGAPVIVPQQFADGEISSGPDLNGVAVAGAPQEPRRDGAQLQGPQPQGAQGEGGRRRRRRRRRGRGPREGQPLGPNDINAPRLEAGDANDDGHDAFDENAPHHESAKEEVGTGYSAPIVTPNAPSAPVWSLASQHASEQPPAHVEAKIEAAPPPSSNGAKVDEEAASIETAPAQVGASDATGQPTRKGWWQRPFRLRD